jgi:hypothetical protein
LSPRSKPARLVVEEVYAWASQLASESRDPEWINQWYMWPEAINRILHQLKMIRGGIFGLVGLQGVGKSSALQALYTALISEKYEKRHKTHKSTVPREEPAIIFKWQQEEDLLKELLNTQDPICLDFFKRYSDSARALPSLRGMVSKDVEAGSPRLQLWEDVTVAN